MKKIVNWLSHKIDSLLNQSVSPVQFLVTFLGVVIIRVFIEQFIARTTFLNFSELLTNFIHSILFFFITLSLIWLYLSFFLKLSPEKLAYFFSWASLIIIFPPLIDLVKTEGATFWSFYILGSLKESIRYFLSFFGNLPSGIAYYGTRIVLISGVISSAILVYFQTKNVIKSAVAAFFVYLLIFIMAIFPSIFSFIYYPLVGMADISQIKSFHTAQLFGTPQNILGITSAGIKYSFAYKLDLVYFLLLLVILMIMFFWIDRRKFIAVIKNFRYPQVIYHSGLFFVGMGLGVLYYPQNITMDIFSVLVVMVLLVSIWLAWKASVVVNDLVDLPIDRLTNPNRPLPSGVFSEKGFKELGIVLFFLSLLGGIIVGVKFFILLLVYQIIAWFYSSSPFRLKKFPIIATFVSSLAMLMILFLGFILISTDQTIYSLPRPIIYLLISCYTLSIPVKDLKDIPGDKKQEIWTIPVIFGEKYGRIIIGTGVFVSYMLSVLILKESRLFWWALLFGSISFLLLTSKRITPRRLPWWILGTVFIYGLILIRVIF